MSWKMVVLSSADISNGVEHRLQDDFAAALPPTSQPAGIRSYSSRDAVKNVYFYFFNPQAVAAAGQILDSYGAVDCQPPDPNGLAEFVMSV